MSDEPEYVEAGDEFGEGHPRPPKNRTPTSAFQIKVLRIFGQKYFADRFQKSFLIEVERSMLPLSTNRSRPPRYAKEWVDTLLLWAVKMRRKEGYKFHLGRLLGAIGNQARQAEFVAKWLADHPDQPQNTEEYIPPSGSFKIITRHGGEVQFDDDTNFDETEDPDPAA